MQNEIVKERATISIPDRLSTRRNDLLNAQHRDEAIVLDIYPAKLHARVPVSRAQTMADRVLYRATTLQPGWISTKRMVDLVLSFVLIVILSPIFVVAAVAVYVESGSPILFKQRRASCRGSRSFEFYKFRSMVRGADEMKDHLQAHNESDGALFKIKNDPRVTRVGKIIRRLSIDELPQLFNVLKGDMSLVGPRPLPVSDLEKQQENPELLRTMRARASVKPGVTGLWQVCGRSSLNFSTMIVLDAHYVENQSLSMDIKILLQTIPAVLRGDGAC